MLISEKVILGELTVELNNLDNFTDENFNGCNNSAESSISDCKCDIIFFECRFARFWICVTITYQHGVNATRTISAPYAYNNTTSIFLLLHVYSSMKKHLMKIKLKNLPIRL